MEILIVTKNRNIGLLEEQSELNDLDYFSVLPGFANSIGMISDSAAKMLKKDRLQEITENIIDTMHLSKKDCFFQKKDDFFLYSIKNIKPVLYEVDGFNCIINFKNPEFDEIETLNSFLFQDHGFTGYDFVNLETHTNYLISSYYEGEASFLYIGESMVDFVIEKFNELCFEKCRSKITVDEFE